MTIDLIAFCTGVVLLLIAIIGGGIKIKEIEVPLLSKGGRSAFAFLGFFFLSWTSITTRFFSEKTEINNITDQNKENLIENQGITVLPPPPIVFSVSDTLWPDQKQESINLFLEEKYIGTFNISEKKMVDVINLKAPKEGLYKYKLTGYLIRVTKKRKEFKVTLSGEGFIEIFEGAKYHFIFIEEPDSTKATISLVLPDAGAKELPKYKLW
jgi:hypothetical protein